MHRSRTWIPVGGVALALALALAVVAGCGGASAPVRSPTERDRDSAAAVSALRGAKFAAAAEQATQVLARDPGNSRAAAVRAIATYQAAGSRLRDDLLSEGLSLLDRTTARTVGERFTQQLVAVDRDLAVAAADPAFSLELCLACWEHDWNHSGEIDDADRTLFEIEFDGDTGELPEGDPRRRPTFRFDTGDVEWARAMITFQRAAMEIVLAYRWSEVGKLFMSSGGESSGHRIVIHLEDAPRIQRARTLILDGLRHADRCRAAYLAETDDVREWVPNPRQHDHPIPLAVDAALYQTWAEVASDVRRLLESTEQVSLRQLAALGDRDSSAFVPDAYLDLGAMLREPADVTIDLDLVEKIDNVGHTPAAVLPIAEKLLRGVLGKGYAAAKKVSPLVGRLERMKRELSTGTDTLERKLRYLLWLN